ncbi:hypothetical protein TWF225_001931 [Orbilia oligospora]|uniref:Uncharacterized protein n=1 Tax=Orbilia oligospora TaxID=2813651 RepID=A0A7C8PUG6_ORBOL|nr:hypothetical protein TWF751_011587 [Orbilia oligospora]KAF3190969.1 hypothetical protein TWF225_001931 [Orbilia oligospora]KAF3262186.1 hypothetical protein TWF217_004256 [Orbilia oligospora]KAF3265328.1 hypothetical protein TWF128_000599 [Orbilia oligospora]KAF3293871.1 hypothetical protein TWF132_004453 [Orbilia oligospora]
MLLRLPTLSLLGLAAVASATNTPKDFYLVTSSSPISCPNSSDLANASAISTFDPYYQEDYLLRTIGPGYNSLPVFNLKRGNLVTIASLPHGGPAATFTTKRPQDDTELKFNPSPNTSRGPLTIRNGLIGYHGIINRWFTCPGDFGEYVITYKGLKPGCTQVYLHAASHPPY